MGQFPPQKEQHWIRILKKLGFLEVLRVGKGKHAHKFSHPQRITKDHTKQPNFIIIPHKIYPILAKEIVKELMYFGFTEDDIKKVC